GQGDGEGGAVAGSVAVGGDGAVVGVDDRFGDGQADAGAAGGTAAGGVGAVEALEEVVGVARVEAVAGVGDCQAGQPLAEPDGVVGGEDDTAAGRGVAQRIVHQIAQGLG